MIESGFLTPTGQIIVGPAPCPPPGEVVCCLPSLPALWADAGPDGRQARPWPSPAIAVPLTAAPHAPEHATLATVRGGVDPRDPRLRPPDGFLDGRDDVQALSSGFIRSPRLALRSIGRSDS